MLCKNCGAALPDGAKFCMTCGAGVDGPFPDAEGPETKDGDETAEISGAVNGLFDGEHEAPEEVVGALEEEPDDADRAGVPAEKNISTMPAPKGVKIAEAPARAPEPPSAAGGGKKEKKAPEAPARGNAGRVILSVLLSILLSVSLFASIVTTVVRACVSEENIRAAVSDIQISTLRLDIDLKKASDSPALPANGSVVAPLGASDDGRPRAAALTGSRSDSGDFGNLTDYFYALVKDEPGWEDVSRRDIREALNSSVADEFLVEMATDYADVLLDGESADYRGLTPERITDFVLYHEDEIRGLLKDIGYTGRFRPDSDGFEDGVRDMMPVELEKYAPEKIIAKYSEYVDVVRVVTSVLAIICFWVLTAILIALIIVVNKRRFSAVFSCVGIPALILGLVFVAGWGAMTLVPAMKEGFLSFIPHFMGRIVLITGVSLTGGGFILILVGSVMRLVRKRRRA